MFHFHSFQCFIFHLFQTLLKFPSVLKPSYKNFYAEVWKKPWNFPTPLLPSWLCLRVALRVSKNQIFNFGSIINSIQIRPESLRMENKRNFIRRLIFYWVFFFRTASRPRRLCFHSKIFPHFTSLSFTFSGEVSDYYGTLFTSLPSSFLHAVSWEAQFMWSPRLKIPRSHGSKKLHLLLIRKRLIRWQVIHQWWWP